MITKERERFEKWAESMTFDISRHESYPDNYKYPGVDVNWKAWKEALGIYEPSRAQKDLERAFGLDKPKVTP